jgi:hypothetical protein
MTQKGSHTWDITIDYHLCPKCKHIVEDRQEYILNVKEVKCSFCGHLFSVFRAKKSSWSLFSGSDAEWDWPER